MKIIETNSEQWEIKESGIGSIVAGGIMAIAGAGLLGWVATHLATIAWWWMLVAVGILVLGGLIIFSASNRLLTLRRQGMSEIVTTKVIGGKRAQVSFDTSQIVSVNLDTSDELSTRTSSDGDKTTTRERTSILYVLLRDNSEVMLATRKGGNNGISINGFNMSGLIKAPLADEARRIAAFYGVPLSSRTNNAGGIETIASAITAVRQGITGAQQPGVVTNMQPQVQPQPQPVVATTPLQPIVPVVTPVQPVVPIATLIQTVRKDTVPTQVVTPESTNSGDQLPQ
jgi:MFS family permease